MRIERGDIIFADFGTHPESSIQSGIRPAIVVSNNKANLYSTVLTVVPLSKQVRKKLYLPTHLLIHTDQCVGLEQNSIALAEQVISIDKRKIIYKAGYVMDDEIMEQLTTAVQIQIGVYEQYN